MPFRSGRRLKAWNSNVVSLGLASGFIEPLESTSIHLTISAVVRLIQLFPFDGISASLVQLYNDVSRQEMEHVRDFIILHYHATQRTEPMWKACREMSVPGSLQQRLQAWRERAHAAGPRRAVPHRVWTSVLLGQGIPPGPPHPLARAVSDADLRTLLKGIQQPVHHAAARMPTQAEFIAQYCRSGVDVWRSTAANA